MVERQDWRELVRNRGDVGEIRLVAPLKAGSLRAGSSGAFLGLADDKNRYWIKPLNNLQGQRMLITEQVVGRAGQLINAPTCEVKTITIPRDAAGWEFQPGCSLTEGIAHASRHIDQVVETRSLDHRSDDDNTARHAAIFALHDWCWGDDPQWLQELSSEHRFFSHDHGFFLPPPGPGWTSNQLEDNVDLSHELPLNRSGIGLLEVDALARRLERIGREDLANILAGIPLSWPVADEELECIGFFLERRAPMVADRLRQRGFGGSP